MSRRRWLWGGVAAVAIGVLALVLTLGPTPQSPSALSNLDLPASAGGASDEPAPRALEPTAAQDSAALAQKLAWAPLKRVNLEGEGAPRKLGPADPVARVDGRVITGADLLALREGEVRDISAESFQFLLDRAIDRTLVEEAAKARGLTLDAAEEQRLQTLAASLDRGEEVIAPQRTTEEVAMRVREARAGFLERHLVAQQGIEPHVNADDVAQWLAAHPDEAAGDRAEVERRVREKLQVERRTAWAAARERILRELRAAADIELRADLGR